MASSRYALAICIIQIAIAANNIAAVNLCPDVYSQTASHDLNIKFGNTVISKRSEAPMIGWHTASNEPDIEWMTSNVLNEEQDDYYTVLMVDPDAPSHDSP